MIAVICRSPWQLFCYWQNPVMGRLGRSFQNHHFNVVIGIQFWFITSSGNHVNWLQVENSRFIRDLHTTGVIQIPIVFRTLK